MVTQAYLRSCRDGSAHRVLGPVRAVAFHPSRPLLVTGGDDYKIKVWGQSDLLIFDSSSIEEQATPLQTYGLRADVVCLLFTVIWTTSEPFNSITSSLGS